ncbi:adenine glycosylase [Pseudoclavibacter endophyticus]|uniref:Adenine DNA glycosylase n=1 Tax=Pseudoclavibacter endophyticus TaxID=1778590 RepID=A0A6H9WTZ3_9MICO|nr:A/G-specific adenine glycosylase [Pseudoclavibacter endophyticus]KAB1649914.1 A/G-specific adenine glycosylase [Pseudoclavibacter endophyticus]GGA58769.1 adenine glycosylase [Pseudoclavibacter endophyticus]
MTAGIVDRVVDWFARAARPLPWRDAHVTPWGVLVSEFMLQQTQAARVEPRWRAFVERWPRPADLASATDADVLRAWDRLGYPRRARWLRACAVVIVERHGGVVPADDASLRALPGVGPYTAAAVASFAYGRPSAVVDTNVRRVIARAAVGAAEPWAPSAARDEAEYRALVPLPLPGDDAARARAVAWNAAAMELGALVCTARAPRCEVCPIADECAWRAIGAPTGTVAGRPRRKQAAYAGSDRQMRGRILAVLRAEFGGLGHAALRERALAASGRDARADEVRYERALRGLRDDGLVVETSGRIALPGDEPPAPTRGAGGPDS